MSNVYIKTKIRSGACAVEYLKQISDKHIMVVCDKFLSESGAIRYVTDSLNASNEVVVFDQAIPDPTTEVVGKGLNVICKVHPDVVIGFGGGSAIDTAKGIIYFAGIQNLIPKPEFITIPTTSGSVSMRKIRALSRTMESITERSRRNWEFMGLPVWRRTRWWREIA